MATIIGINGDFGNNVDRDHLFADYATLAGPFQDTSFVSLVATDAAGNPLADCGVKFVNAGATIDQATIAGPIDLSFTGQAEIDDPYFAFPVTNQQYDAASNTTTARLTVPALTDPTLPAYGQVVLCFRNTRLTPTSPVGSGIANLKAMRPVAPGAPSCYPPTAVFTDQALAFYRQFGGVTPGERGFFRDLDRGGCNRVPNAPGSTTVPAYQLTPATRVPPTAVNQSITAGLGWAIEYLVLFGNATNLDVWYCIPDNSTADHFRLVCQIMIWGSDATGTPYTAAGGTNPVPPTGPVHPPLAGCFYFAYSNECANTQFSQNARVGAYAEDPANRPALVAALGTTNHDSLAYAYPAYALLQFADIARAEFGAAGFGTRYRPVVNGLIGQPGSIDTAGAYLAAACGARGELISANIWGMGSGWYWNLAGLPGDVPAAGATVASILAAGLAQFPALNQTACQVRRIDPNLAVVNYEGGGVCGDDATTPLTTAVQADPGMSALVRQAILSNAALSRAMGIFASTQGAFGLTQRIDDLGTAKLVGTRAALADLGANGETPAPAPGILQDPSFEGYNASTPAAVAANILAGSTITTGPWTFGGTAGIADALSLYLDGQQIPDGYNCCICPQVGSFAQSFTLAAAGSFQLAMQVCQRRYGNSANDFVVLIDGMVIDHQLPTNNTQFAPYLAPPVALAAGAHTVAVRTLQSNGLTGTLFFDQVQLVPAAAPSPTAPAGIPRWLRHFVRS